MRATPRKGAWIRAVDLEGDLLLMLPDGNLGWTLNSSARAIWELCDGHLTIIEISRTLDSRFGIPDGSLLSEVYETIRALVDAGVLGLLPPRDSGEPAADI